MLNKKVITPEQVPQVVDESKARFDGRLKSNKVKCVLWQIAKETKNPTTGEIITTYLSRPKALDYKTIKVGAEYVELKGRLYWVNYDELKEGEKEFILDIDERNALGALNFYDRSERQISPNQAEMMLKSRTVKLFKGDNGIPMILVIALGIAVLGSVIIAGVFAMLFTEGLKVTEQQKITIEDLQNEINKLTIPQPIPSNGVFN